MDERTAGIRQCVVRTFGRVRARLDNELTHDAYPSTSLRGQTLPAAPSQPGGVEEGRGQAGEEGQVGLRERGEEDGEREAGSPPLRSDGRRERDVEELQGFLTRYRTFLCTTRPQWLW